MEQVLSSTVDRLLLSCCRFDERHCWALGIYIYTAKAGSFSYLPSLPPSLSIRLLSGSVFDDGDDVDSFEDKVIIPTAQCVSECVRWLSMLCQDMYTVID